jgi:hypothetical protein
MFAVPTLAPDWNEPHLTGLVVFADEGLRSWATGSPGEKFSCLAPRFGAEY